jgi:molybdenum cofactor cytidylyltransferase
MALISAVVLAAGLSLRMGRLKQLLPFGNHTVIEQVVGTLLRSPVDEVLVVVGHERARIEAVLAGWPVRTVFNAGYAGGEMLSSVQAGLGALAPDCRAALLALGDMPGLERDVVGQLVDAYHRAGDEAVYIPSHRMRAGHPVLVPRPYWEAILGLPPGSSLRSVLRGPDTRVVWVEVDTPSVLRDVDTPEEYERELRRLDG